MTEYLLNVIGLTVIVAWTIGSLGYLLWSWRKLMRPRKKLRVTDEG